MQRGYGKQVDVWSLGVILFILLCGYPPFYDENDAVLFELIMKGRFHFDERYWSDVSSSAKDLIRNMLQVDPVKRYNTYQVLEHPWITGEVAVPTVNLSKSISMNLKKTGLGVSRPDEDDSSAASSGGAASPVAGPVAAGGASGRGGSSAAAASAVTSAAATATAMGGASRRAPPAPTTGASAGSPARYSRAAKVEQYSRMPDARKTVV